MAGQLTLAVKAILAVLNSTLTYSQSMDYLVNGSEHPNMSLLLWTSKIMTETEATCFLWSGTRNNNLPLLTRVLATGQEERSKPESSAAKLYCLLLQEPESKSKSSIAYIFRSQSARAQEQKQENGETPSPLRRIILCLGRVTP